MQYQSAPLSPSKDPSVKKNDRVVEQLSLSPQTGQVKYHIHNNIDAPYIPITSIRQYQNWFAQSIISAQSVQVQAFNSNPLVIIPAPGGSQAIIVQGIAAKVIFNSVAYTGSNPIQFRYTNGSGTQVTATMSSTFLNSAATNYDYAPGISTEFSPTIGAPVVAYVPTANPGAGNSTIQFTAQYRIINF